MIFFEGWRGFGVPPVDDKLDIEGKSVVDQSFVRNLNSRINQVSASGNSLFQTPPPTSGNPPIPPFVITDENTAGQSFGRQGTRQQRSDNSAYSVSINRRPYNGPVYNEKRNCLT